MSRLIIKGIPTRYDDKQLRELFSFAGEVTDARVIKTRDGKSRQFGFVGFRTAQEAKNARHRLDKSYMDTAKVSVEFAQAVGAEAIPRPWSKYSKGSSEYDKKHRSKEEEERKQFLRKEGRRLKGILELKKKEKDELVENDKAAFHEFEETAGRRSSKPIWADGSLRLEERSTFVPSRKRGGEGRMLERKHVTFKVDDGDDDDDDTLYDELPTNATAGSGSLNARKTSEEEEVGNKVALSEQVSDLDYFKSKIVQDDDGEDSSKLKEEAAETKQDGEDDDETDEHSASSVEDAEEGIANVKDQIVGEKKVEEEEQRDTLQRESGFSSDQDSNHEGIVMEDKRSSSSLVKEDYLSRRKAEIAKINPGDTGRLLVRNLAYSMTEEELETIFEPFGSLSEVHIVKDSRTGKSKGMAFVQYLIPEHAPRAMIAVDGIVQNGRILHILPAKARPTLANSKPDEARKPRNPGDTKFKIERAEARKDAARKGLDNVAQHALHMSSDAVAQVIADRNSVTKAELYGAGKTESGIAAVRLAMGEAMLQSETRQFLSEHGIDLEAVARASLQDSANTAAAKRKRLSRTAFIAKNLPARSTENQLDEVFSRFGKLRRLILVPSGLLAVIEFVDSSDAKRAYNSLAYTKFGNTPLYLEWLPHEALREEERSTHENSSVKRGTIENNDGEKEKQSDSPGTEDNEELLNTSIYVKNLNFDTRDEALREHFEKVLQRHANLRTSFRSAKVAMKRGGSEKESERLSMGFGFLEFSAPEDAAEVVKVAQNTVLDGHTLQLRLSTQTSDKMPLQKRKRSSSTKKAGPKLIVRNVAFQATRQDIKRLFSSFGQLKKVRIPKRMDGTHRGFAFVEFASKNEAKSAFEALSSAHLYGRHLVIEYADEQEDGHLSVGQLQAKMAAHMAKKRIKLVDGNAAGVEDGNDKFADEEAMIEDEMYG